MSYLQSRNNLGDLENIVDAKDNLGLGSLASQMHTNVNIENGRARLSALQLPLPAATIKPNYVLMASNDVGDVMWRELVVADWLGKPPQEISLAGMCNDANFVTKTELDSVLLNIESSSGQSIDTDSVNMINEWSLNNRITISNLVCDVVHTRDMYASNLVMLSSFETYEPSILTHDGTGSSNLQLYPLIQSFSNNQNFLACSAKALSNLYTYVTNLEKNIPDDTAGFMISTNNFADPGLTPTYAVSNLGLNESFKTRNLTIENVIMQKPTQDTTTEFFSSSLKNYSLVKQAGTNKLIYEEKKLIHSYTDRTSQFPASAYNVNTLYEYVTDRLNQQMLVDNVLSEIVENNNDGSENPYRSVFRQRLRTTGIHEVAFTGNWNDLINAPRSLSAFDNMNGNNETLFLYSKSNFSDIVDKSQALNNLGVSPVGVTGNFEDIMNMPEIIQTLSTHNLELSKEPGIPFLIKSNFLEEFKGHAPIVRSNLGIGDLALDSRLNVSILDGDITVTTCSVKSNLHYLASNVSLDHALLENDIYLKCYNSEGFAIWDKLPRASTSNAGMTMLTHDVFDQSYSNAAITPYGLSRLITSNSLNLGNWRLYFDDDNMSIQKYDALHDTFQTVHTFS